MSVGTTICGRRLDSCIWNASGPRCSTKNELQAIAHSRAGAVQAKSATYSPRTGNPFPRYWDGHECSINSEGLPNRGVKYYASMGPVLKAETPKKPYVMSISGLKPGENLKMLEEINRARDVAWVEINLSCPNIPGKPLLAYDFNALESTVAELTQHCIHPIGIKLPPYFDMNHFSEAARILNDHSDRIAFVVCCNTMGNGLVIDTATEQPVISPKGGFGGIAGAAIKPTALANVRQFYLRLKGIKVIGAGGVRSGEDVFQHILCGASAVQVATEFKKEGVGIFARLENELQDVMRSKGYASIEDFRGQLKDRAKL